MTTSILAILLMAVLLCLHELGHVFAAKALRLSIEKIGFSLKPWPHPFVSVRNVADDYRKVFFLSAGLGFTLLLFAVAWMTGALHVSFVYYAFCAEIILETNPFYSDFTTMFNTNQQHTKNYQAYYQRGAAQQGAAKNYRGKAVHFESGYYFSAYWYVHLFLWMILINALLSFNLLKGYFLL